ncbi:DUF4349 domain-containing protein [Cellulosimicrobium sp. Marseille-Q4280]|uniref:DUF4349 domain-containing protein n=1 Tax=Cellulosimicrobium sp. Marseille-Q4280 TaxID=2937992 RepID=UPI0020405E69|nr:DUF4349 domain-containing protein [Cellulosimicrobium sp. Marseille-Q4280]
MRLSTRRLPALAVALVLGGALLAGCSGGAADSESGAAPVSAEDRAVEGDGGGEAAQGGADDAVSGIAAGDEAAQAEAAREIVTTGWVTVVTADPVAGAAEVADLAESAGGRVETRNQSGDAAEGTAHAELTIRVPADRTTATLDALEQIGEVDDLSVEAVDVTGTARDLDARVEALTTSVDRLRDLMGSAGSTEDLLAAEQELTTRQAELESLQSQRAALTDQVAMSTVTVSLVQVAPVEQLSPGGFLGGLENGWNALLATLNGLVVVVGALLPWLVVGAAVALVVRWVLRRRRRAGAGGTPPSAGDPAEPDGGPGAAPGEGAGVGAEPLVGATRD